MKIIKNMSDVILLKFRKELFHVIARLAKVVI